MGERAGTALSCRGAWVGSPIKLICAKEKSLPRGGSFPVMRSGSILNEEAGGDRCGYAEESVDALSHGGLLALAAGEDAVKIQEIPAVLSVESEGDLSLLDLFIIIVLEEKVYVVAGKLDGLGCDVGSCDCDRHNKILLKCVIGCRQLLAAWDKRA